MLFSSYIDDIKEMVPKYDTQESKKENLEYSRVSINLDSAQTGMLIVMHLNCYIIVKGGQNLSSY